LLTPLVDWASLDSAAVVGISPGCSKLELRYQYEWQQPVAQATTVGEEVLELNCTQNCNWLPTSGKQMVAPSSLSTGIALFLFSPKLTTAFQRSRTATSTRKLW
jgi:hypothetical protein